MNQEFNYIKKELERSDKVFVEILDYISSFHIVTVRDRITAKKMIESDGSIEDWFINHIKEKGYKKIQVQLFKSQGTANVRQGKCYIFSLDEPKEEVQNISKETLPQAHPMMGLQAPQMGFQGLAYADVIDLKVKENNLDRVSHELALKKEKIQQLEKEKEELKEKNLSLEKKVDNRQFFAEIAGSIAPALKEVFGKQSPVGLQNPAPQQKHDGIKGQLIEVIANSPTISDNQGMAAYYVLEAFSKNNTTFIEDLEALFNQHNITNGNTNNSNR